MDIHQNSANSPAPVQSIYTHALHFLPLEGFDLMSLTGTEGSAALELLEMVMEKKTLPVRLIVTEEQAQLFWHFYSEQKSREKMQGSRPLGLGYPLVIDSEETPQRAMPVFIWTLRIEPSLFRVNEWEIYASVNDPCHLNPYLMKWATDKGLYDLPKDTPPHPSRDEVDHLVKGISSGLALESTSQSLAIMPCSQPAEAADQPREKKWLLWAGVIGVYPPINLPEEQPTAIENQATPEMGYPYGALPQDPYQASALAAARTNSLTWVEGIAGAGKTHLLTQITTMALANGQKCLVVSPSASNLKEIQGKLGEMGIQRLLYLIRNPETETGMLLDFFRAMAEGAYLPPELDGASYHLLLDRCERERQKLDERYTAIRRPIFGQWDWTETVGLFLESNRKIGKELLDMQLYSQDFAFNYAEFEMLNNAIVLSQPLYQKVNTLKHVLSNLHPSIFLNMEKEEGRTLVADRIEVFHGKATRLQRRYFSKVNQYGEALRKHYDNHYQELSEIVSAIKEKMAEGKNQYGQPFEESSERRLRLYGLFSRKQKAILEARIQIENLYEELKRKFDLFAYFDFQLPAAGSKAVDQLRPTVLLFEEALSNWQDKHSSIIQDNVQRLSRKTVHPRLHLEEDIEELEDNLDLLLDELNTAQLYGQPLEHNMLTIPKRQRYLESVIEQLEETKRSLADFNTFYDWQRNWLLLNSTAHKLLRALIKVKPTDWEAAFRSWYLHHCLNLAHTPKLPQADDGLTSFVQAFRQLQPLLASVIARNWDQRRLEALRQIKSGHKKTYQLLFGRTDEVAADPQVIKQKWAKGLAVFSEVLPVLLVGELVIPYLPREGQKIYDYILVDEAHLLRDDLILQLQQLGHHLVIFSDPSLEKMNSEVHWPAAWRDSGAKAFPLQNIYQWRPGNLRQLIGDYELSSSAFLPYSITFEDVAGRYDEQNQTNSAEAEMLITVLNRIEKTPQRTFPTVGIVCMTRGQRNLINQLLFQIKKQDSVGADTIRQLERNGMGVYALDELGGQHFDTLIFSGVWGIANSRGHLTEHLRYIDRPEGLAALHLLMGRGYKSVYALNSLPLTDLEEVGKRTTEVGRFLYANYLLYLQALAREDLRRQEQIVQRVRDYYPQPRQEVEPVFPSQVVRELSLYLRNQRVATNMVEARFPMPIVIHSLQEKRRPIVVQPDAFFAHCPATDYIWEYEQRKQLLDMGYSFLPAWSVRWWRETSLEAKRMAATVLNLLDEEDGPNMPEPEVSEDNSST